MQATHGAGNKMRKSVFSYFGHSRTIVARARAVRMSLGATPEAQGGRSSGRTEGLRRGLSARANLRGTEGVKDTIRKVPACAMALPLLDC